MATQKHKITPKIRTDEDYEEQVLMSRKKERKQNEIKQQCKV